MSDVENTMMMRADRGEPDDYVRISAHPRAARAVARSKAIGGLAGFVIGLWLADRAGLPAWDAGVRALAGGIAGYVLMWLAAVQIWRQIIVGEYRAMEQARGQVREVLRRDAEERAAARAEAMAAPRQ